MKVRLYETAQLEFGEAIAHYEEQVPGLGERYRKAVKEALNRIKQFPEAYSPLSERTRRCLVSGLSGYPDLVVIYLGMRQYWRDFESLESWARSEPHRDWWQQFLSDSGGTGFWHEAYFMRGGMEAVYDDMVKDTGFLRFAPVQAARGHMFSARGRAQRPGASATPVPVEEDDFYP